MNLKSKIGYKPFSEEWANDELRWFIEFLKEDTWRNHPYFKIIVAWNVEDILRCAGYSWHAARVLNHLHRWMKGIKLLDKDSSQNNEDYHRSEKGLNRASLGLVQSLDRAKRGLNRASLGLVQTVDGDDSVRRQTSEKDSSQKNRQRVSVDTPRERGDS